MSFVRLQLLVFVFSPKAKQKEGRHAVAVPLQKAQPFAFVGFAMYVVS